jgi:carboxypeptidase C (cathepsin A)
MDKWAVHTQDYVANLLDRGLRVLIYAGTYDWQSNWIANKLWVDKLEWSGHSAYAAGEWRNWSLDGKTLGEVKQSPLLTFATIRGAGHMISTLSHTLVLYCANDFSLPFSRFYVPHDKPAESLAMVSRWRAQEKL